MLNFRLSKFLSFRRLQYIASLLFALVYIEFAIKIPNLWIIGLFPIVLFIAALQYTSRIAYFLVLSVAFFSIFSKIDSVVSNIQFYMKYGEEAILLCSCDPLRMEIGSLQTLVIDFVLIGILHNSKLAKVYNWRIDYFLISIALACLIFICRHQVLYIID